MKHSLKKCASFLLVFATFNNAPLYSLQTAADSQNPQRFADAKIDNQIGQETSNKTSALNKRSEPAASILKETQNTPPPTLPPSQTPTAPPLTSPLPPSMTKDNDFPVTVHPTLDYPISIVLTPLNKAVLSSLIPDNVDVITKKMGDRFTKGELLVLLDQRIFQAKVRKAAAIVERARYVLSVKKNLYADRVASEVELADAQANLDAALADLAIAAKELSDTEIKAPFNGNVVDVYVDEYEMVQPGQKLIAIVNSDILVAKMLVPSIYLNNLYIGQPLQLRIKETHELIEAKVTQIGVVIDPSSSMVKVYAEIDNHEGKLTAGMIGTAKIEGRGASPEPSEGSQSLSPQYIPGPPTNIPGIPS